MLMKETTHATCPTPTLLAAWFDGTLAQSEADRVEDHLDQCGQCRQHVLDWSERLQPAAVHEGEASAGCPDGEALVAYCHTTAPADAAAAGIEAHLRRCIRCVQAVQQIMRLDRQLQEAPTAAGSTAAARVPEPARAAAVWWERLRELLTPQMWPSAAVAFAALVLVLGVTRFVLSPASLREMQSRGADGRTGTVQVEIIAGVAGRARPADNEPVVAELQRGLRAQRLETSGQWVRIELGDGRRVWVPSTAVEPVHEAPQGER